MIVEAVAELFPSFGSSYKVPTRGGREEQDRGGPSGGLGGYSPRRRMLGPHRKVKGDFFGEFWHL